VTGRRTLLGSILAASWPLRPARAYLPGQALRRILDRGELRILISPDRPPFAMRNAAGELAGYDVAVGRMLAEGLGVEPVFVEASVPDRSRRLFAGAGDIACHVPVTAQFARTMLLTAPYLRADISIASPGRRPLRRLPDLEDRSVGVLLGSGAQLAAAEILSGATRLVLCPTYACLSSALAQDQVDAVVLARAALPSLQRLNPQLALVHRFVLAARWISVGLPFGEHDLLRVLNGLLYLARNQGRLGALSEAFLGQPLPELPSF
jgi:polar amino acid transport system substrate-binding protein